MRDAPYGFTRQEASTGTRPLTFANDRRPTRRSPAEWPGFVVSARFPLSQAHDEVALTLGRLLSPRLHLIRWVWDAREQRVADRRDELRRDTNMRRLLVVVGEADQLRFGPAAADEGDPER